MGDSDQNLFIIQIAIHTVDFVLDDVPGGRAFKNKWFGHFWFYVTVTMLEAVATTTWEGIGICIYLYFSHHGQKSSAFMLTLRLLLK